MLVTIVKSSVKAAVAALALMLLISSGCAHTDDYWSMPIWGSAIRGDDNSPLYLSLAPLLMLKGMGQSTAPEAALAMIGVPVCASAAILVALTAFDLAILPITLTHDAWLYSIRRNRGRAKRSAEFRRVLFDDDPEALDRLVRSCRQ